MGAVSTAFPLAAGAPGRGERLARRTSVRVALAEMLASGLGAVDVFLLLWLVLPKPPHEADPQTLLAVNAAACVVYMLLAGIAGVVWGNRSFSAATGWLREDRAPTEAERAAVLRQPAVCAALEALGWAVAAVVFALINLQASPELAFHVGSTILMGGLTCTALGYLLVERALRPVTAEALAAGPVRRPKGPGVVARLLLAWVCATGVPLAGLLMLGSQMLINPGGMDLDRLYLSIVVLAGLGAAAGLFATWLVARSLADPLTSVQRALKRFEEGDLGARVAVDDGSEVGLLQSGFNAMAAGVAERERLRDAFGRHVGEDVARRALRRRRPAPGRRGTRGRRAVRRPDRVDVAGGSAQAGRGRAESSTTSSPSSWTSSAVTADGSTSSRATPRWPSSERRATTRIRRARRWRRAASSAGGCTSCRASTPASGSRPAPPSPATSVRRSASSTPSSATRSTRPARLCELAKRRDERLLASSGVLERARNGEAERWAQCDEVLPQGPADVRRG